MMLERPISTNGRPGRLYQHLYVQVLAAIALGVALGHFWPELSAAMKPLGDGFIRLVRMIIAPVIFLTIVTGIAGMADLGKVGRVAFKAFGYFLLLSTLALVVGLVVANVLQPGSGMHVDPAALDAAAVSDFSAKAHERSVAGFVLNVIPSTFVGALADGEILQVLFISILFGVSLALVGEQARPLLTLLNSVSTVVFRLVALLMRAAPVGAFGAMAFTIGRYGVRSLADLAQLVATFCLTSATFVLVVLGTVARLSGFSILRLIVYLKAELLLVLGTSSSEAALPSLMEKMEAAGCPGAVAGVALILGIDRSMSECRALTNFIGNAVATIVVSRWEKVLDAGALERALHGSPQAAAAALPADAPSD